MRSESQPTPALPAFLVRAQRASERVARCGTLFVLGCQKSGTTWLQMLLNAHPAIALNGEGHFTSVLAPVIAKAIETHNAQTKAAYKFENDHALACIRCLIDQTLDRYIDVKVALGGDATKVRWIGDKTPEAAVAMPLLDALYPGARFIHVIRDGRDGVVSGWAHLTRENSAGKFASVADYADYFARGHWISYITLARRAGQAMGNRYMEVRYEAIHADPASETRRMLTFLGVDASDAAVEACVRAGSFEALSGGRARGDADDRSHFRSGRIGDFARSLTPEAIARFEAAAGPLLTELGYSLVGESATATFVPDGASA
jgi:hypothetical protein